MTWKVNCLLEKVKSHAVVGTRNILNNTCLVFVFVAKLCHTQEGNGVEGCHPHLRPRMAKRHVGAGVSNVCRSRSRKDISYVRAKARLTANDRSATSVFFSPLQMFSNYVPEMGLSSICFIASLDASQLYIR